MFYKYHLYWQVVGECDDTVLVTSCALLLGKASIELLSLSSICLYPYQQLFSHAHGLPSSSVCHLEHILALELLWSALCARIEPRSHRNYLRRTSDNSAIRESEEKMEWGEQSSPFICKVSYFAKSSNHRTLGAHSERAASRARKGLCE